MNLKNIDWTLVWKIFKVLYYKIVYSKVIKGFLVCLGELEDEHLVVRSPSEIDEVLDAIVSHNWSAKASQHYGSIRKEVMVKWADAPCYKTYMRVFNVLSDTHISRYFSDLFIDFVANATVAKE